MLPKLIISDIDGVWTDGGMYYTEKGDEFKKFHTYDSAGVMWAHLLGIPIAVITGEMSMAVKRRCEKLKVDFTFIGVNNKVTVAKKIIASLGIDMSQVAFIGDDINDIELLKIVGLSCCPNSAPQYVKQVCHYVTSVNGGCGAFRAFVEKVLMDEGVFESNLEKYFSQQNEGR